MHFVVHKSSHPIFLWESNFQFNFLSCDTGLMVFTNPLRPPGLSCAAAFPRAGKFSPYPGDISSFPELCVPPLARVASHTRVVPAGDVLGTFVELEENEISSFLFP